MQQTENCSKVHLISALTASQETIITKRTISVHFVWLLSPNKLEIFTARIRRMGEGTVFSLFVSPHLDGGGGTLSQVWVGGGTSSQVRVGGTSGGYPVPGLGSTPSRSGWWGVPHPRSGGYPIPGLDGGGIPPQPGLDGVPPTHPLDRAA